MQKSGIGAVIAMALGLCCCVTPDDMRRENFIGSRNGESEYRFWAYRERDIAGRTQQLCPNGAHEVTQRQINGRDTIYNQGVALGFDKIWVTIACPKDHP
ncbi:MAG: hypothetical protein KBF27_05960 [Cypionkella sp.]|nr:hypothetical protein [Cypionkella sp.]